jgi:hypothetical protein
MAQVVEWEALSSNPSTEKKKKSQSADDFEAR